MRYDDFDIAADGGRTDGSHDMISSEADAGLARRGKNDDRYSPRGKVLLIP